MHGAAHGVTLAGVAGGLLPWPVLLVLVTVPPAIRQVRLVWREREFAALNRAWFGGVRLHTQFAVLLIAGLVAARLLGL
jgi:1,4-dihydroxy-2-naphthoate octaprenyltransferase